MIESANVRVGEDSARSSRYCGYDSDDQETSTNKGKNSQTQNQLQIVPINQESQEGETSASVEERIEEPKVRDNTKVPWYVKLKHSKNKIIGDKNKGVQTRRNIVEDYCLISKIEPKDVNEACNDEYWMEAMKEELMQIEKNDTWILLPRPKDKNVIGTKWVFRNKLNEHGEEV